MSKSAMWRTLFLLVFALGLIACGGNDPADTDARPADAIPEESPITPVPEEPTEEPAEEPADSSNEESVEESPPARPTPTLEAEMSDGYPAAEMDTESEADVAAGYPAAETAETAADVSSAYPVEEETTAVDEAAATTFVIVSEESEAVYEVDEEFFNRDVQFVTAVGRTSAVSGDLQLDLSTEPPTVVGGEITVDISTLQSDSNRRDQAIRDDWLESATYPLATFSPTAIENYSGDEATGPVTFTLVGDMTIRDTTNEVAFNVTAELAENMLTGNAQTVLYMADYGFEPPSVLGILEVTDGVTVTVNLAAEQE